RDGGDTPVLVACAVGFAAVALALLWARTLDAGYLAAAAIVAAAAFLLVRRAGRSRPRAAAPDPRHQFSAVTAEAYAALAVVAFGLVAGSLTAYRLSRITSDWDRLVEAREMRLAAQLDRRMSAVLARGRRAADVGARMAAAVGDDAERFAALEALRRRVG